MTMNTDRFNFISTPLAGLTVVQRKTSADHRGFLSRFYCAEEFRCAGFEHPVVQINHTLTYGLGAVRGLHFQFPPYAEDKLVSCLKGKIYDVAVDLRRESPTFLHWHGEIISAENRNSFLVPKGCAHGYQSLSAECELIYLHTAPYHPEAAGALNARDPVLNILWPLPIAQLSEQDSAQPFIDQSFLGIS